VKTRWTEVIIKVIPPPPHKAQIHKIRAHPGHAYEESHIHDLLSVLADKVDTQFTKWEFRLVELAPNRFSFIFDKLKDPSLMHAGKQAALLLEQLQKKKETENANDGSAGSSETPAVPVAQESPSVEDKSNPEREQQSAERAGVPDS
jgi:hypothetical protein